MSSSWRMKRHGSRSLKPFATCLLQPGQTVGLCSWFGPQLPAAPAGPAPWGWGSGWEHRHTGLGMMGFVVQPGGCQDGESKPKELLEVSLLWLLLQPLLTCVSYLSFAARF